MRHFVADDPPPADVRRVEGVLRDTGGDLGQAAAALITLAGAWQPLAKLRSPQDYVLAALRAADCRRTTGRTRRRSCAGSASRCFGAPFPIGWPDRAADWAGPEAMMRRVDWSYGFSGTRRRSTRRRWPTPPRPAADAGHATAIARAGSRRDGLTLLFTSPEFQRR